MTEKTLEEIVDEQLVDFKELFKSRDGTFDGSRSYLYVKCGR